MKKKFIVWYQDEGTEYAISQVLYYKFKTIFE